MQEENAICQRRRQTSNYERIENARAWKKSPEVQALLLAHFISGQPYLLLTLFDRTYCPTQSIKEEEKKAPTAVVATSTTTTSTRTN